MTTKETEKVRVDAVFEGYEGKKRWHVIWNGQSCDVAAPTEEAAIVASAEHFGQRWQSYSYYPYCTVMRIAK